MKRLAFVIVLAFLVVFSGSGLAQNKVRDGKKFLLKAKRAYIKGNYGSVKRNLKKALKKDESNPEIVYLVSSFFYNQEPDIDRANKYFEKFQKLMRRLSEKNGGIYMDEYERLKRFMDIPPDLGMENPLIQKNELDRLWKPIESISPEGRCREGIFKVESEINLKEFSKANLILQSIEEDCAKGDRQLAGTVAYFKALLASKNGDYFKAASEINRATPIEPKYSANKEELRQEITKRLDSDFRNSLQAIEPLIEQKQWRKSQESLNQIIQYSSYVSTPLLAEYHHLYAQTYLIADKPEQAYNEIKKAEELGLPDSKITPIIAQIKNSKTPTKTNAHKTENRLTAFKQLLRNAQAKYRTKDFSGARELLNSATRIESQSLADQKEFYRLLTNTLLATYQFDEAAQNLKKLKKLGNDQTYRDSFNTWTSQFLGYWDKNIYRIKDKDISKLESLSRHPDFQKGFSGRLYYLLAKAYKNRDEEKFTHYLQLAERANYDPIRIAGLKQRPKEEPIAESNTPEADRLIFTGQNIQLLLSADQTVSYTIYPTSREYLGASDVQDGRRMISHTNKTIPIETGRSYKIELDEMEPADTKTIYGAAVFTVVIALFLYIR